MRLPTRLVALFAAAAFAALVATGCASLDEWQRQTIFNPARDNPRWFSPALPGTDEYDIAITGGESLHFWYVPQPHPEDAPTVLYLHGARWNLNGSVFRISRWHQLGFNVLAVDYRGFGKSSEILPSEASAADDARVALAELKRRQPDAARRFLYGHSLGGALAIELASGFAHSDEVAGLIVESTFTSIPDIVRETKWGWVPGLSLVVTQRFDSAGKIEKVKTPLLIVHGTADSVVPHTMADALYERAGSPVKRVVKIEGGTHSGARVGTEEYRQAVQAFMQVTAPALSTAAGTAAAGALD
jgi:alpha-beta hydrolase superfamily lysophospholipase